MSATYIVVTLVGQLPERLLANDCLHEAVLVPLVEVAVRLERVELFARRSHQSVAQGTR